MQNPNLWLIEDDRILGESICDGLFDAGFSVRWLQDGALAYEAVHHDTPPEAMILDLGLPGLDGEALLQQLRDAGHTFPILILTARGQIDSRIRLLDAGADDYLPKPFHLAELVARLRALLRRSEGSAAPICLKWRDLRLSSEAGMAWKGAQPLALSAILLHLLAIFMAHPHQIFSHEHLCDHLYGQQISHDSNPLAVHLSRLRRLIGDGYIENIRGQGWRLI